MMTSDKARVAGQSAAHDSAREHVTGGAQYVDDMEATRRHAACRHWP